MLTIHVKVAGVTPLLQHRFSDQDAVNGNKASRPQMVQHLTPREEADAVVYRSPDGSFYIPGTWFFGTMCNAGANHKLRGTRKSARFVVPAAVRVTEIDIPLLNGDGHSLAQDFEVDSRPVTIPATKGRIMRHRPRFDHWSAAFHIVLNDALLPEDLTQQLLTEAGQQIGIGDFRPEKRGPFGTFRVTEWTRLEPVE